MRAAVRWSAPETPRLRGLALFNRISELSMAAAISAFLFVGAVTSAQAAPALPDLSRNAAAAGEWTLNGRNALQRPIESRATDYRAMAGEVAENGATVRRSQPAAPAYTVRDSEPFAHRP